MTINQQIEKQIKESENETKEFLLSQANEDISNLLAKQRQKELKW